MPQSRRNPASFYRTPTHPCRDDIAQDSGFLCFASVSRCLLNVPSFGQKLRRNLLAKRIYSEALQTFGPDFAKAFRQLSATPGTISDFTDGTPSVVDKDSVLGEFAAVINQAIRTLMSIWVPIARPFRLACHVLAAMRFQFFHLGSMA
jgi:hypothetical protein